MVTKVISERKSVFRPTIFPETAPWSSSELFKIRGHHTPTWSPIFTPPLHDNTHRGLDGERVLVQSLKVQRAIGKQGELVGPVIDFLVEATRLTILVYGLPWLDDVVHIIILHGGCRSHSYHFGIHRSILRNANRCSGVVLHPLRVRVHCLGDLNFHVGPRKLVRRAAVPSFHFDLYKVSLKNGNS